MGRTVTLHYDRVEAVVEIDVDTRKVVKVDLLWPEGQGLVRPVRPIDDEMRELERLAQEIADDPATVWPRGI